MAMAIPIGSSAHSNNRKKRPYSLSPPTSNAVKPGTVCARTATNTVPVSHGDNSRLNSAPSNTRTEEHTSELQSLMRTSYAAFCLKKNILTNNMQAQHVSHTSS